MTNELKPCPFCGSEAKLFTARGKCNQIVRCVACNVSPGYRQTKKEAIEAWNTRAERTCELDMLDTGNEAAYEHYEYIMHCRNCHHEFGYVQYNEDGGTWQNEKPSHCPSCGAKVVD